MKKFYILTWEDLLDKLWGKKTSTKYTACYLLNQKEKNEYTFIFIIYAKRNSGRIHLGNNNNIATYIVGWREG